MSRLRSIACALLSVQLLLSTAASAGAQALRAASLVRDCNWPFRWVE